MAAVTIAPSKALLQKREVARDYAARVLDPAVSPSIEYVRLTRPADVLQALHSHLKAVANGQVLEPDYAQCRLLPPLPAERLRAVTDFLAPLLADLAAEAFPQDAVAHELVKRVEAALKAHA